ncbi:MAG: hypothetical protein JWP89_7015 [Schlesneria sp.]|nr:hypothetical protein [Schlesneria sp.]
MKTQQGDYNSMIKMRLDDVSGTQVAIGVWRCREWIGVRSALLPKPSCIQR